MARAYNQAQKFGVEMAIPDEVIGLDGDTDRDHFVLRLSDNESVKARSIVIASGARYDSAKNERSHDTLTEFRLSN